MNVTILDCYTDEASGLGVPPYLGTYPRYIAGKYALEGHDVFYLTIDDLRLYKQYGMRVKEVTDKDKTNIKVYNLTNNSKHIEKLLQKTNLLVVNLGVHVPGKYLSAIPGTLREIVPLLKDLSCKKILSGPAVFGTQLEGGKFSEKLQAGVFDQIEHANYTFDAIKKYSLKGASLIFNQIPDIRMIEIETGKGCNVGKCSFCLEPIKNKVIYRDATDILQEFKEFYRLGARYFRLGKQTCFYSYPKPIELLKAIRKECPDIKVLHIDNVNPIFVPTQKGIDITKAIVQYCTSGNIAAFGVESFDSAVTKANTLNCSAEMAYKAAKVINQYGKVRGENGMPKFLPGINIIFGLMAESKKTHEHNMHWLQKFLDEDIWLRRINIRQAAVFEGTSLYEQAGTKFLKKNKKYYWKWRNDIRQKIDFPMLQKILPKETMMKEVQMEIYDGKTTFGRQLGTYPLIVGVKGRYPLRKFYTVKVTAHMLRSVTGEVV